MTTKLTPAGTEMLKQIGSHGHSFFDDGITADSGIWMEALTGESGAAKTVQGNVNVARKLADDGFLNIQDVGDDSPWVTLTELGATTAVSLATPTKGATAMTATTPSAKETAKEMRLRIEAEAAAAEAADLLGDAAPAPAKKAAAKKAAPAKKAAAAKPAAEEDLMGDLTDLLPKTAAKKAAAKKATPPAKKAVPAKRPTVDPLTRPADVSAKSLPKDLQKISDSKWRNRARTTGTVVGVYDGEATATKDEAGKPADRWILHCEAHDAIKRYRTYSAAWLESAHPEAFCSGCSIL